MAQLTPAAVVLSAALAACGGGTGHPPEPVAARPYQDPGLVQGDGFEMRYAVVQSSSLDRDVARRYGIVRSEDRALITVAVSRQRGGSIPVPMEATISGIRRVLAGDSVALDFRAVSGNGAVSYVAETDIPDYGPLLLEIEARPADSHTRLAATITRRFDEG